MDQDGNTPLFLSCARGQPDAARALVVGGANADASNKTGEVCVHMAMDVSAWACVDVLVDQGGVDIMGVVSGGNTILHNAAKRARARAAEPPASQSAALDKLLGDPELLAELQGAEAEDAHMEGPAEPAPRKRECEGDGGPRPRRG